MRCVPLQKYFDNLTQICVSCPTSCLTCQSLTLCTSCVNGYFLQGDNLCYNTCPPRYFINTQTLSCQKCPSDCYTCNFDGTCITCNATSDFRQFDSVTSRCIALDGYFDNLSQTCVSCPINCLLCSSLTLCTSCANGSYLTDSKLCETSCPPRQFENNQSNTCQKCPFDCYTCNNVGQCTSCSAALDFRSL